MSHRFRWASIVAGVWALLPLAYCLPGPVPDWLARAILVLCYPACFLAYSLAGGVHSDGMVYFPVLCALFTWIMVFGVFVLVTRVFTRECTPTDASGSA